MTTVRHEVFPAASEARMVTEFEPLSKGIVADQFEVPLAVPVLLVLVDQVTAVTPMLSLATPLSVMEAAAVEIVDAAGETMLSPGGVVSAPAGPATLMVWETRLEPAV